LQRLTIAPLEILNRAVWQPLFPEMLAEIRQKAFGIGLGWYAPSIFVYVSVSWQRVEFYPPFDLRVAFQRRQFGAVQVLGDLLQLAIYAFPNSGGWYDLGFVLGCATITAGAVRASESAPWPNAAAVNDSSTEGLTS
jgi:hypothetical protein